MPLAEGETWLSKFRWRLKHGDTASILKAMGNLYPATDPGFPLRAHGPHHRDRPGDSLHTPIPVLHRPDVLEVPRLTAEIAQSALQLEDQLIDLPVCHLAQRPVGYQHIPVGDLPGHCPRTAPGEPLHRPGSYSTPC